LGDSGELVRYPITFYSPSLPVGNVETGEDGNFEIASSVPVENSSLQAVFSGDERYLSSRITATLP
jgi:hypothetical protein